MWKSIKNLTSAVADLALLQPMTTTHQIESANEGYTDMTRYVF